MDTEQAQEELVNSRLAYVSVSRGRNEAQIYTNDAEKLGEGLSRDVSKHAAIETRMSSAHSQNDGLGEAESRGDAASQTPRVQQQPSQEHVMDR